MKSLRVILFASLILGSIQAQALADPPIDGGSERVPSKLNERINFSIACEGLSDLPHISMHVPGTVNVQARTTCPGKGVEISSRLTRTYRGVATYATKSNNGHGQTSVNISMKCIWKKGMKKIKYQIRSTHRLSDGQVGVTYNYNDLEC